ncbi:hypothetical protein [Massilia niastensis]|uniref:hypothetical protein n=1 Tax=Massilia niastensis TaxID=544911 RepID=UPI001E300AAF|nr:hypothetical protein [Massilia niastensis]
MQEEQGSDRHFGDRIECLGKVAGAGKQAGQHDRERETECEIIWKVAWAGHRSGMVEKLAQVASSLVHPY